MTVLPRRHVCDMADQTEHSADSAGLTQENDVDRRALLRRLAIAGAVGWVAPVVVTSSPVSAGVFTAKCAPGAITATATWVRINCLSTTSAITITLTFNGPCPCGGTKRWCVQKNTPAPAATSTTATLSFPVTVPAGGSTLITGKVALGCADRDGDIQYAVYTWSLSAYDNYAACSTVVNSLSAITFTGRTLVTGTACPPLAAAAPLASPSVLAIAPRPV